MNDILSDSLTRLTKKSQEIKKDLRPYSEDILKIEKTLQRIAFNYPVHTEIIPDDITEIEDGWYMTWEFNESSRSYRIHLVQQDMDGNTVYKRPMIETPLKMRMKFKKYMEEFLEDLYLYMDSFVQSNDIK